VPCYLFLAKTLTPDVVLKAIAIHANVDYIHLGIDEYNILVESTNVEQVLTNSASRNLGCQVLKEVVTTVRDTMGTVRLADSDDFVMVTALFSGTMRTDVDGLFAGSFGQCRRVTVGLLTFDDILSILRDLPEQKNKFNRRKDVLFNRPVLAVLALLGTVPRGIEYSLLQINKETMLAKDILKNATLMLQERYSLLRLPIAMGTPDEMYQVLQSAILSPIISTSITINNQRIDKHERNGYIILDKVEGSISNVCIRMPYLWLYTWVNDASLATKPGVVALREALNYMTEIATTSDEASSKFELFCCYYRQAFIQMVG
jgi:hypothetical protein